MKDLTLKFADRADFSAFMESIGYYDDESMQDDIQTGPLNLQTTNIT